MHSLCRRYRVVSKERTGIRETVGKKYGISRRNTETESEPERKVVQSVYMQYEILSTLVSVLGRAEKESMSVSMESHGRKPRITCESSLPGVSAEV